MVAQPTTNGRGALHDELLGTPARREYNHHEQQFSVVLRRRLDGLLQGERNQLYLLRVYPQSPERLGVVPTPVGIDRGALRVSVVRRMLEETLLFLYGGSPGGPAAQQATPDGRLIERRTFPTKYPHIVIEREDVFAADGACTESTWYVCRVQNQRAQTEVNRLLDVANLGVEIIGLLWR